MKIFNQGMLRGYIDQHHQHDSLSRHERGHVHQYAAITSTINTY